MRLLLAEDDEKLGKMLCHLFRSEDIEIDYVNNGADALSYGELGTYDVIILDWMMPLLSGAEVCQRLREQHINTGIILLTAKDTTADKVFGLDTGADDYVVKPVEFDELLARVKAVYRRGSRQLREQKLTLDDLTIDVGTFQVRLGNDEIKLTHKEFKLLELLMSNAGKTITREIIFDRIWNNEEGVMSNTLDVYIKMLRSKLDKVAGESRIKTVRGIGYRME